MDSGLQSNDRKGVEHMRVGRREIVEDVIANAVMAGTVLGYASTHEQWNVWLIGDSRRWTAGLLVALAIAMFALVARHVGGTTIGVLVLAAGVFAVVAFWTASLTPLSFLAATIVVAWAFAVLRDVFEGEHRAVST
jgi:hypothetical protein